MIRDVHHVGLTVPDLDGARAFFADQLRLPEVLRGAIPPRAAEGALFAVGSSYVEVMAPLGEQAPADAADGTLGAPGLDHLALATTDMEEALRHLRGAGLALGAPDVRREFTGSVLGLGEAVGGVRVEVIETTDGAPDAALGSPGVSAPFSITRIDHVVVRTQDASRTCDQFARYLGVPTKRTFTRGDHVFSFLRPGDIILEVVGPSAPAPLPDGKSGAARAALSGLAFEVTGIDELAAALRRSALPVGDPHPALQGGRIMSVHASATWGVPIAFIDYAGAARRPSRAGSRIAD
jgi:catechol 2,3-dioxygenase-like lactoylglutathione lyase family enzyme